MRRKRLDREIYTTDYRCENTQRIIERAGLKIQVESHLLHTLTLVWMQWVTILNWPERATHHWRLLHSNAVSNLERDGILIAWNRVCFLSVSFLTSNGMQLRSLAIGLSGNLHYLKVNARINSHQQRWCSAFHDNLFPNRPLVHIYIL